MIGFYSIYKSFDEFYDTMFRGNEIEFKYNQKRYYLLPHFEGQEIVGTCVGESETNNECIYLTKAELYNAKIENVSFCEILTMIDICWYNF